MEKIKEALWQNYEEVNDLLEGIDVSSNEFRNLTEEREKIRNGINIRNFYCKYNCNCICYNKDIQI